MRVLSPKYTFYYERYGLGGFIVFLILYKIAYCAYDNRKIETRCKIALKYLSYFFLEMAFTMLHSGRFTSY